MRFTKRFMFMRWAMPALAFMALYPVVLIVLGGWNTLMVSLIDHWYELLACVSISFFCSAVNKWVGMYHEAVDMVNACQRLQDMPADKVIYEPIGKILNVHAISRCSRVRESVTAQELWINAGDLYSHLDIIIARELAYVKCWEEEGFHSFLLDNFVFGVMSPTGKYECSVKSRVEG